ncbi:MAG: FeoB-associated Cys-rich membrane protein [Clostridia bacterium]|nr:FeoB-associated Cys-rich membrane protein [Clostridia bacterium]
MTWVDVVVLVGACVIVGSFFAIRFWRKKTGKSKGCGCGCDCSSCSSCPSAKTKKEE